MHSHEVINYVISPHVETVVLMYFKGKVWKSTICCVFSKHKPLYIDIYEDKMKADFIHLKTLIHW